MKDISLSLNTDISLSEAHCVMIETMPSNKTQLHLRLVLKIKDLKSKVRRINYAKSVRINSGQAILNLARAVSAHAALPLGGFFIACLSPPFSWFAWVTARVPAIAQASCHRHAKGWVTQVLWNVNGWLFKRNSQEKIYLLACSPRWGFKLILL